jgi:hypothetical protein
MAESPPQSEHRNDQDREDTNGRTPPVQLTICRASLGGQTSITVVVASHHTSGTRKTHNPAPARYSAISERPLSPPSTLLRIVTLIYPKASAPNCRKAIAEV